MIYVFGRFFFFFFNDTATTEIYTLSLHDALPILRTSWLSAASIPISNNLGFLIPSPDDHQLRATTDRKSTRLNSSHGYISYAVFCLKKKKNTNHPTQNRKHPTPNTDMTTKNITSH